jgi:uncharacterized protein
MVRDSTFRRSSSLGVAREEAFAWHARPGAFERLTPPFEPVRVRRVTGRGIEAGTTIELAVGPGPLALSWTAEHTLCEPPELFVDVQRRGPFALWEHEHRFESAGPTRSRLEDHIRYRLPLGALGRIFGAGLVERKLARMFTWRHRTTSLDLDAHRAARERLEADPSTQRTMRILVTGASGLVGRALCSFLSTGGHEVVPLERGDATGAGPRWDPAKGAIDAGRLEGFDAVVHLAGESIAGGRWSASKKAAIRDSRIDGTRLLVGALTGLARPPRVLVTASAVGYYGSAADASLDESSPKGDGFLADVAADWEAASEPFAAAGGRVVHVRLGMVLDPRGGALGQMLLPARLGAGGPLGSGKQWWSWIALEDAVEVFHRALTDTELSGAYNAVAPEPVRQAEFARVLGRVLNRPAFLPAPAFALRLALGEMADALLLASQRVVPKRLTGAGFQWRLPDLEGALRAMLGR